MITWWARKLWQWATSLRAPWWWQSLEQRWNKRLCRLEGHQPTDGWRLSRKGKFIDGKLCGRCWEWLKDERVVGVNRWANMLMERCNR